MRLDHVHKVYMDISLGRMLIYLVKPAWSLKEEGNIHFDHI